MHQVRNSPVTGHLPVWEQKWCGSLIFGRSPLPTDHLEVPVARAAMPDQCLRLQLFILLLIRASCWWNSVIRAPRSTSLSAQHFQQPRFCWSERLTLSIWPPRDRDYKRAGIKGNLILSPHLPLCLLSPMFANRISSCCLQFQKPFPFSLGLIPATSAYCYNLILQDATSLSSF